MHGGKAPTAAEKRRMARLTATGCRACDQRSSSTGMTCEVHHPTDCGRRVGHHATYSLCMYHHRGVPLDGWFDAEMIEAFGPAVSHGTRLFKEAFGTDESLLLEQNKLLEGKHNGTGN